MQEENSGKSPKIRKNPQIFFKKATKFKIWRKMYVDNAVKSTWASHFYDHRYLKREQLKIGTFLGNNDFCDLFTILSLIFGFLIIFGKKNKNFRRFLICVLWKIQICFQKISKICFAGGNFKVARYLKKEIPILVVLFWIWKKSWKFVLIFFRHNFPLKNSKFLRKNLEIFFQFFQKL